MAENTIDNLKSTVAKEGIALGLEAEGCPPQLAKPIAGAVVDKAQSSQNNKNDQNAKQSNSEASEGNDRSGMVAMVKEIGRLVATAVDGVQKTAKKASQSLSGSGLDSSGDQQNTASSPESPDAEADNKPQSNKSKPGMSPS